jgi:hypothetical protein
MKDLCMAWRLPIHRREDRKMKKALLTAAFAAMAIVTPTAALAGGPGFYGGWNGPYWNSWGPYWGPYGYYGYFPNTGEVKIETNVKGAQIYINGGYAGRTHHNKRMYLSPGTYNIQIRENGKIAFAQNVYVTAGKTVKLCPPL